MDPTGMTFEDLKWMTADERVARAPHRVDATYAEYEPIIGGGFDCDRHCDYARIHFKGGGCAWMDAETGVLVRGIPPKRRKRRRKE